jgi:hypothetical protein
MNTKIFALSAILIFGINSCATPHVVETKKTGDNKLSCNQLEEQIEEANRFEKEARSERTVTGKNVAAAVLFWPALLGTYANTEEAINAARDRKSHLNKLYDKKNCK